MAAGQQKRLSATNISRFTLHEQHRGKKKKRLELSNNVWNMKPHIYLEWDEGQKKALARKEQVAITWRDISSFSNQLSHSLSGLADVFSIPKETYDLENVSEVLSYEVWETCLSESERSFLVQFLPKDMDPSKVVRPLLIGENLNFGNPFDKWSASLCSGNLHPDVVLHKLQHIKANKMLYNSELRKYHYRIIERLLKWKEIWLSCGNSENEFIERLSRKGVRDINQESSPPLSDKAKPAVISAKEKTRNEMFQKNSCTSGKFSNYMSCLKISRRQHQLVKSMKHLGEGILSKSLIHVIGDIEDFNLQPYEAFEEEERKRLHDHWLLLACKDIPSTFQSLRNRNALRKQWKELIGQELTGKKKTIVDEDEEKERMDLSTLNQENNGDTLRNADLSSSESLQKPALQYEPAITLQNQGDTSSISYSDEGQYSVQSINRQDAVSSENINQEGDKENSDLPVNSFPLPPRIQEQSRPGEIVTKNDFVHKTSLSALSHCLDRTPLLNSHQDLRCVILDQHNKREFSTIDSSSIASQTLGIVKHNTSMAELKASASSAKAPWEEVDIQSNFYEPTQNQSYISVGDLSINQSLPVGRHTDHLISMENHMLDEEMAKRGGSSLNIDNRTPFFGMCTGQGDSVLLPCNLKEQQFMSSFPHDHLNTSKGSELPFVSRNGCFVQSSRFSPLGVQAQSQQPRGEELYLHRMINKAGHSNGDCLSQGNFLSTESQNWAELSSPANRGQLGHNLYPTQHQLHNGFFSTDPSATIARSMGQSGSADGCLLSVVSELKHISTFSGSTLTSEQLSPLGHFEDRSIPNNDSVLGIFSHKSSSATNHESDTVATSKVGDISWMNFPYPNTDPRNSFGEQFARPWSH